MNNRYLQALNNQRKRTEQKNPLIAGTLGITQGGQQVVEVPDRPSYVYVQVRSSQAEVIQAFNARVAPVYGLPVLIQWQGNRYIIFDRDSMRYSNWIDSSAYLPRHASTHEWEGSAGDVVFVSQEQLLPLEPMPSGSTGNKQAVIGHYNLMATGGNFSYFPTQVTQDLTVWKPSSPTGAIMVLVSLDASNTTLHYDVGSGSVFGNWLTGTSDVLQYIPPITDLGRYVPIAGIRLVNTTTVITWDNIYDVRPLFGTTRGTKTAGGAGGTSTSIGVIGQDEGILLGTGSIINWVGAGVTVTMSGTVFNVNIPGGGGGGGGTGFLALDASNGPLTGPLVVYKSNPNSLNQYFDRSVILGYQSGTSGFSFAAAVEAVTFSTGSNKYGVYVDDEGAGTAFFAGASSALDVGPLVEFSHNIELGARGRYFNDIIKSTRWGGNGKIYIGNHVTLNEQATNYVHGPTIEIQNNFSAVTDLFPMATGRPLSSSYPFPSQGDAPYGFDTAWDLQALITGTTHTYWSNQGTIIMWLTPNGDISMRQLRIREYPPSFGPPAAGSTAQGVAKLTNGTVTIATTLVTMSSRIYLTTQFGSGSHVGYNYVYSRGAGSGFTVRSSDLQDTSLVAWLLVEPT